MDAHRSQPDRETSSVGDLYDQLERSILSLPPDRREVLLGALEDASDKDETENKDDS